MRDAASGLAAQLVEATEGPGSGRRLALPAVLTGVAALVLGFIVGGVITPIRPSATAVLEGVVVPLVAAPAQAALAAPVSSA
ncbi:MAG TPA: hypothetical protein VGI72_03200, partial [Gaiellales bacterium]